MARTGWCFSTWDVWDVWDVLLKTGQYATAKGGFVSPCFEIFFPIIGCFLFFRTLGMLGMYVV